MNDYDDSEDYSSANSFRARSNTWPLNRPDLAVPNSVCIDETLPEIELEEDDLFTTNETWSTGLVDHDIMSWDPILNAQNLQLVNTTTTTTTTSTLTSANTTNQQQPLTLHHQSQQLSPIQQQQQQQQQSHHQHLQQQPQHQQQTHDALLSGTTMIVAGQQQSQHQQQQQQQHQISHQLPPQIHQTLNTNCLDADDPNDYHIQQLHHLSLDNNQATVDHQTHHYSLSSTLASNDNYHPLSSDHHHHQPQHHQHQQQQHHHHHHHHHQQQQHHELQPLTSARYDQQNDLDLKAHNNDQHHHQQPQLQPHHHHVQHVDSPTLDHHSHMLSSSLSTTGIGLSDLDYKSEDQPSIIYDELPPPPIQGEILRSACSNKLSNSNKTKTGSSRKNLWGPHSYADLITTAINNSADKRLTLSQIYDWMVQNIEYFKDKGDANSSAGWKNSVRHNLSLHNKFKRVANEGTGKSSFWILNPEADKPGRRRAASMGQTAKLDKKRVRAKRFAASRQLVSGSKTEVTDNSGDNQQPQLSQSQHHQHQQQQPQQQPHQQQPHQQQPHQQQPHQQQPHQHQPQQQIHQHQPQPQPQQHQPIQQPQIQTQQQPAFSCCESAHYFQHSASLYSV